MKILQKRMKAIEKSKAKTKARSQKPKAKGQKPSLQTKQNKKMKSQIKLQYPPSTCCLGLGMQATATLNLSTTISLFWSKIEIMDALCHRKGTCYWKIRTLSLDALQKPCTCEARSSRSFLLTTWSLRGLHLATSAWENTLFWEPQRNPKTILLGGFHLSNRTFVAFGRLVELDSCSNSRTSGRRPQAFPPGQQVRRTASAASKIGTNREKKTSRLKQKLKCPNPLLATFS